MFHGSPDDFMVISSRDFSHRLTLRSCNRFCGPLKESADLRAQNSSEFPSSIGNPWGNQRPEAVECIKNATSSHTQYHLIMIYHAFATFASICAMPRFVDFLLGCLHEPQSGGEAKDPGDASDADCSCLQAMGCHSAV